MLANKSISINACVAMVIKKESAAASQSVASAKVSRKRSEVARENRFYVCLQIINAAAFQQASKVAANI